MSKLQLLQRARTVRDLADLLELKPSSLTYLLYKLPDVNKYTQFSVPKASGGTRAILSPCDSLKAAQRKLKILIEDCIHELEPRTVDSNFSHGFKRNLSIVTNASVHRNKRYVFNTDLTDFFPSIHFGRVRGYFMKNRNFDLSTEIATMIAQLACHAGSLPQGSPSSPIVSNLVAHILDIRLASLAAKNRCSYSRYADDITFSTNEREFPKDIAVLVPNEAHQWEVGVQLSDVIVRSFFAINPIKTRMQYQDSRQSVTGLVVNKTCNASIQYRRLARAKADTLFRSGAFHHLVKPATGAVTQVPGKISELLGIFSYLFMIDQARRNVPKTPVGKYHEREFSSMDKVHRDLLFYTKFYATDRPTIICEGKTDYIYLHYAIRRLAADFPALVDSSNTAQLKPRVNFIRSTRKIDYLLDCTNGSSNMARFIREYGDRCKRFECPRSDFPVIILVDNDDGADKVFAAVKHSSVPPLKADVTGDKPYYYVTKNLYVVPVPKLAGGSKAAIEDLFTTDTLATLVNGKQFSRAKTINPLTEYGKQVFAEQVIKKQWPNIEFDGFKPLLETTVLLTN